MAAAVVPISLYALFPPKSSCLLSCVGPKKMILIREFHYYSRNYSQGEGVLYAIQKNRNPRPLQRPRDLRPQSTDRYPHDPRLRATIQPKTTTTVSYLQGMPRRCSSWKASSYNEKCRGGTRPGLSIFSSPESLGSSRSSDRFKDDSEDNDRRRRTSNKSYRSDVISSACRYTQACMIYLRFLFLGSFLSGCV